MGVELEHSASLVKRVEYALSELRARYADADPRLLEYFDSKFLHRVMSKMGPEYADDEGRGTLEGNVEMLLKTAQWREKNRPWEFVAADELSPAVVKLKEAGVLFWQGYSRDGYPVLYSRPGLIDMEAADAVAVLNMHCLERLDRRVAGFIAVIDISDLCVSNLQYGPGLKLVSRMKEMVSVGYRDRMARCLVGPVSFLFEYVVSTLVAPLLPERVMRKVTLSSSLREQLEEELADGEVLPDFLL